MDLRMTRLSETMQDEITKLKAKMKEVESNQSTLLARLTELETKPSSVVTAEISEPAVAAEAAPQMELTSEAPREPAAPTPVAVEEAPTPAAVVEDAPTPADAEEKSEEAKEVAAV
jgi:translation initiation factor IF-2